MKRLLLLIALLLLTATPAWASFAYMGTFTVQSGQMASSQTDFSFAIYWTDNVLKQVAGGGQVTDVQGDDIRPYSTSDCTTTALTYQRTFYDGTAGTIGMRVKSTGGVGHTIYLCVGDSGVTTDGSSTSAYDANTLLVLALGNGTTLSVADSSASANNGTNTGYTATAAKLDGGAASDGTTSNKIVLANGAVFSSGPFTISGWVNSASLSALQVLFSQGAIGSGGQMVELSVQTDGKIGTVVDGANRDSGNTAMSTGTWYHIGYTYNATSISIYLNGAADGTATRTASYLNGDAVVGNVVLNGGIGTLPINGSLDEVRVDGAARSADWFDAEYHQGNSQGTFWGSVTFSAIGGGGGACLPCIQYYRQRQR